MNSVKEDLIAMISFVAEALSEFSSDVCFIGGAVVSLYCDPECVDMVRPTKDVDCVIEVVSRTDFYKKEEELRSLGFKNDVTSRVICRWKLGEVTVDIMPSKPELLSFENSWYAKAFAKKESIDLSSGISINLFPLPYFLASKFNALEGRGGSDWRMSHDLEDIVAILGSCSDAQEKIERGDRDVIQYLISCFSKLCNRRDFEDILSAHIRNAEPLKIERVRNLVQYFSNL